MADDIQEGSFDGPDPESLPISKRLMEDNDWITLQDLFDEEAVRQVEERQAQKFLFENFVSIFSDSPEEDMETIFLWTGEDDYEEGWDEGPYYAAGFGH